MMADVDSITARLGQSSLDLPSFHSSSLVGPFLNNHVTADKKEIDNFLEKHELRHMTLSAFNALNDNEDMNQDLLALCGTVTQMRKFSTELADVAKIIVEIEKILAKEEALVPDGIFIKGCKYISGVSNCKPRTIDQSSRGQSYSLIIGSSGSGKSMLARHEAHSYLYGTDDNSKPFVVMIVFSSLIAELSGEDDPNLDTLSKRLRDKVVGSINNVLHRYGQSLDRNRRLRRSIRLMVVLDEVNDWFGNLFANGSSINVLADRALGPIAEKYHLVLAGTLLALVPSEISSLVEAVRFRMAPWTIEQFETMVDAQFAEERESTREAIKEAVARDKTLATMIRNPRCAYFLACTLKTNYSRYSPCCNSDEELASIVSNVSFDYLKASNLNTIMAEDTLRSRFLVARATLRAAHNVLIKYQKGNIQGALPAFGDHLPEDSKHLLKYCYNLVDINVETQGSYEVLVQEDRPPISISPALMIVLSVFLGQRASILWHRSGFEHVVCMGELFRAIRTSELDGSPDPSPNGSIVLSGEESIAWSIQKSQQLPGSRSTKDGAALVRVPQNVSKFTVVLNGDMANGADYFFFRRLGRMKYNVNSSKPAKLQLLEELNKMGGTCNFNYSRHQGLIHLFEDKIWSRADRRRQGAAPNRNPDSRNFDLRSKTSLAMFPANTLVLRSKFPQLQHKDVQLSDSWFEAYPNKVTLVFVTNCNSFCIPGENIAATNLPDLFALAEELGIYQDLCGHLNGKEVEAMKNKKAYRDKDKLRDSRAFIMVREPTIGHSFDITDDKLTLDGFLQNDDGIPAYIKDRIRAKIELQFLLGVSL